jgi:hypothetical protein
VNAKTREELEEMTDAERREWAAAEEINVFGVGFKRDSKGRPLEQGLGSEANPTPQHWQALAKYESQEVADRMKAEWEKRHGVKS